MHCRVPELVVLTRIFMLGMHYPIQRSVTKLIEKVARLRLNENAEGNHGQSTSQTHFQFHFGSWFQNPWSGKRGIQRILGSSTRDGDGVNEISLNPLLPKITMVGISMFDWGQMSRASLKKTMEDMIEELEQASQKSTKFNEDKDPLVAANVGDYYHKHDSSSTDISWKRIGQNRVLASFSIKMLCSIHWILHKYHILICY